MICITADRVRRMISGCHTEMEVAKALRSHKVKYSFSTDTGVLALRIPCHKGSIRIYRTCSRTSPFMVHTLKNTPCNPVPTFYNYR